MWDESFTVPIEDPFLPISIKVFDYDWGLQVSSRNLHLLSILQCTGWAKLDNIKGKFLYLGEIGENRCRCLRIFLKEKPNVENHISISIVVSEIQSGIRKSAF